MTWLTIICLIYCIPAGIYFTAHFVTFSWLKHRGWQSIADLDPRTLKLSNHRWIMPNGKEFIDRGVWKAVRIELNQKYY